MVRPFFTNLRLLALTIILLLGWGLSSYQSLPRQEDPQLVSRVAVITTAFPGASAERVEALVSTVLEDGIHVVCPEGGCTAGLVSRNRCSAAKDDCIELVGAGNGEFVVDGGHRTLRLPGRVLTPSGSASPRDTDD